MNRFIFAILLLLVVGSVFVGVTYLPSVSADKKIFNKCVLDTDTGKCEFDQTFKSKKGDIRVENEIDASAIATAIANGTGGGATVDEFARSEAAKANSGLQNLTGVVTGIDSRVGGLENDSEANIQIDANQTGEIAKLWDAVNEAITDVTNETDTGGGGTGGNDTEPLPTCAEGEFLNMSSGQCEPSALPEPTNDTDTGTGGNETEGNFTG